MAITGIAGNSYRNSPVSEKSSTKSQGTSFRDLMNSGASGQQIPLINEIITAKNPDDEQIYVTYITDDKIICNNADGSRAWEMSRNLPENMTSLKNKLLGEENKVPYSYLAKDGTIEYNGVVFVCDYEKNRICLGDVTNREDCISVPLSEGGSLVVNRENLGDLSKAIGMFSPEDIKRIMQAIARDTKCQQMQNEIEDAKRTFPGENL